MIGEDWHKHQLHEAGKSACASYLFKLLKIRAQDHSSFGQGDVVSLPIFIHARGEVDVMV